MALLPLIFSLAVFPLVVSAQAYPWYAVFWNNTLKTQIQNTWQSSINVTSNDLSTIKTECDHTTIAFNPSADLITGYTEKLSTIQSVHVLGYAHDEHGQAILLRYDGNNNNVTIPTTNSFPHTTISHQNSVPYTAVYSNDLWARVNASGAVTITFRGGFPDTLAFTNPAAGTDNQTFALPAITIGANNYIATTVFVHIVDPATAPVYTGTFCVNSGWSTFNVCVPPTTAPPTTQAPTASPNGTTLAPNATSAPTLAPNGTTLAPNATGAPTLAPNGTTIAPNTTNAPTPTPKNDGAIHGMSMLVATIIMMLGFF